MLAQGAVRINDEPVSAEHLPRSILTSTILSVGTVSMSTPVTADKPATVSIR